MELLARVLPSVFAPLAPAATLPHERGAQHHGAPPASRSSGGEAAPLPLDTQDRYSRQAYAALGLNEEQFNRMDPVERNTLISAAYARMYMSDPDTYKWAGMAAYASDSAGVGMLEANGLDIPGVHPVASGLAGGASRAGVQIPDAPEGAEVRELLARGNAEIFKDMYWQHLAFQQGGLGELERAAEEGSVTPEQLAGWRRLAEGREALRAARESGDAVAIAQAQDAVWDGNATLLHAEQHFVQGEAYDGTATSRDAFRFLSSPLNPLGIESPIPGGQSLSEHRQGRRGPDDVGDFDQRWDWIENSMLPSYRLRETRRNDEMMTDMRRFSENAESGIPGIPGATRRATEAVRGPSTRPANPFAGLY